MRPKLKYDSRDNCNAVIETATNTLVLGCRGTRFPESVPVIGTFAFSGCGSLTSIDIPSTISYIDKFAFYGCPDLTSVNINNSVDSIGDQAFYCSALRCVTIGTSVKRLGISAFQECDSLQIVNWNAVNCTTPTSAIFFNESMCLPRSLQFGDSVQDIIS